MKAKTPTKLLTLKLRAHLKEIDVRCTVKDVTALVAAIKANNPGKLVSQVCRECAEIAHRLGVAV